VVRVQAAQAASARAPVADSVAQVFVQAVRRVQAVLPVAAMIVAPVPTTSVRVVAPMVQAAAQRLAVMRRLSRGAHRT